ncbi:hypothetical protein BC827DRAFT_1180080 [Russula dissimulans]|nr:hypothetical protein BC827DRAFT_1180080 [Russula dissimulans]
MAPTLRSNMSTPGRSGIETTPIKSPRKIPHCTKCQRPRAGHPRQGCPYMQSPNLPVQPMDLDITTTMDSLAISPTRRERHGRPPAHEMTLASLSTDSSDILNRLLEPENTRDPLSSLEKHVGASPASEPHPSQLFFEATFQRGQSHARDTCRTGAKFYDGGASDARGISAQRLF